MRRWAGLAAQFLTLSAWGAGEAPHAPYHPPEVLTWTSGIQVVVSLLLVLGVMAAAEFHDESGLPVQSFVFDSKE